MLHSEMLARWLSNVTIAAALAGILAIPGVSAAALAPGAPSSILKVLTYNVAGLPDDLSRAQPSVNLPIVGHLLNHYDLALVQEDFAYPLLLRQAIQHSHASPAFVRGDRLHFGDGLSQFARWPFREYQREAWTSCHGIFDSFLDCLTPKGFTVSRQQLAPALYADVYNLHMDAGRSPGDRRARAAQIQQLARAIRQRSQGQALIVAGDFNLSRNELAQLRWLGKETGLRDSCLELRCKDPWRIDRVLYRSSDSITLKPLSWRIDPRFVDSKRRPLSDHEAVAVEFGWQSHGAPGMTAQRAAP